MTSLGPRTDEISNTLTTVQKDNLLIESNNINVIGKLDIKGQDNIRRVYNPNGISPALTTMEGGSRQPKIIENNDLTFLYLKQYRIRKLTPRECWRLMSFDDEDIDKCIAIGISNTSLYKQAGNSIVVKVLEEIFKNLFKI